MSVPQLHKLSTLDAILPASGNDVQADGVSKLPTEPSSSHSDYRSAVLTMSPKAASARAIGYTSTPLCCSDWPVTRSGL